MASFDPSFGLEKEGEPLSSFEALVAELSERFIHLAPAEVDGAIEDAQRLFCEKLGLERSSLFQYFEEEPGALLLTHLYERGAHSRAEKRAAPRLHSSLYWFPADEKTALADTRVDVKVLFPWIYQQLQLGKPLVISSLEALPPEAAPDREAFQRFGTQSTVVVPLWNGGTRLGCLSFASLREPRRWSEWLVRRFQVVANTFSHALASKRAAEALRASEERCRQVVETVGAFVKQLQERAPAEGEPLEIKVSQAHSTLLGQSRGIQSVLQQVEQVAPTDSPVLLLGETGTGKELVAREIHRLSPRGKRTMVVVNCATLPAALMESELFGHERGAFTGAANGRLGHFEVADGSTIFLDEIGELTLEMQVKLLRVLQESQLQRLGSSKTYTINVRVIAATNRDLAQETRQGKFREDLFYRLNVFPIQIPPLRERLEDIRLLALAFVQEFAARMNKPVSKVSRKAIEAMQRHAWPGNIRELRNVIERGIILSSGDTLRLPPLSGAPLAPASAALADMERQHIVKSLEKTGWRIKGPYGAAKLLDLKPGTLYSRMKKLGIPLGRQKDGMPT